MECLILKKKPRNLSAYERKLYPKSSCNNALSEKSIEVTTRLRRKNGEIFPVRATLNHIEVDGVNIDCAFCRDITEELRYETLLKAENERLRWEREMMLEKNGHTREAKIIGRSPALKKTLSRARRVARSTTPVMIYGETGVGKESMARYIHRNGDRNQSEMVIVNCGAITTNLAKSRLFGHRKGSFTGAYSDTKGAFELADGGTIFLDEIGELPLEVQALLLRVLQDGTFVPLGGEKMKKVNVRVIAATNRDLRAAVVKGEFRRDLLHRIDAVSLTVPPLRERREDIPALVKHFLHKFNETEHNSKLPLLKEELDKLQLLPFPGNIRELRNIVLNAFLVRSGQRLTFGADLAKKATSFESTGYPFLTFAEMERRHIIEALRRCAGKVGGPLGAARVLQMNHNTLRSRIRKIGITKEDWLNNKD